MKKHKLIIPTLTAMVMLMAIPANAQQFQVSHLKKAATKLKLDSAALYTDTLPATKVISVDTQKVIIRKDDKGMVEHIGVPLFANEMRQLQPSPIYDFLEFNVLDRLFKVSENTLTMRDLKFEKGNLNSLARVMDNADGCSVENIGDKYYRVRWTAGNTPLVVVSFPIDYELLANSNRKELETNFIRDVQVFKATRDFDNSDYSERLKPTNDPDLFVATGDYYLIEEINDSKYIKVIAEETDSGTIHRLRLLYDRHAPQESLSNLMVEPGTPVENAMIELEFVLGNYKRETVTLPLRQWTEFCIKQGCRPYFGFEENNEGTLTGTLIMCNKKSGYDHIVAITAEEDELFTEKPRVHARVYLFTPSSNVKNLFGTATKADRPRIRYSR